MTQDCDLEQDAKYKTKYEKRPADDDKRLLSILSLPLYNAEHVFEGEHLGDLKLTMAKINKRKTPGTSLMLNERPRYHYLEFPDEFQLFLKLQISSIIFPFILVMWIFATKTICLSYYGIFREDSPPNDLRLTWLALGSPI